MSDFKTKMHQIRFRLGLRWGSLQLTDPAGGAYSAPPDPLTAFGALLLRGGEERGGKGKRGGKGRKGKGKGLSLLM